mgnify:CR=1 FL=1
MKREDIERLAELARIELREGEAEPLSESITTILGYVSDINTIVGTEKEKNVGVVYNVMREDVPSHTVGAFTEEILSSAPERTGQYIQVKKILGAS